VNSEVIHVNRREAEQIQTHALDAADAIKKIEEIIATLSKDDRSYFGNHLAEIYGALDFGVLRKIYERFPDLSRDQSEPPEVSSTLKWNDISLPSGISAAMLDAAIFAVLRPQWLKMARVLSDAEKQFDSRGISVDLELLGARIQVLADTGRIDSQGNLSMWRHSEVRLPQT
jgi:hypothetical protein